MIWNMWKKTPSSMKLRAQKQLMEYSYDFLGNNHDHHSQFVKMAMKFY